MKSIFVLFLVLFASAALAQPVLVRNVTPVEVDKINYPNMAGNTTSSQPHPGTVILHDGTELKGKITFFRKKEVFDRVKVNTGEGKQEIAASQIRSISLDPKIFERKYANDFKNPLKNLQPGYIVLPTGDKLTGKVAQVRDFSDYDFFTYTIIFLPENAEVASSFSGGRLNEFGQEIGGVMQVWDGYADGYLLRMVDGRFRLSRNPYSKTNNEFFTSIKNQVADSLSADAARSAFAKSLEQGGNINESMENAANAGSVVSEVLGGIEINKKEYLIFDTRNKTVTSVNDASFKAYAQSMMADCQAEVKSDVISWSRIEEFVRTLNAGCR